MANTINRRDPATAIPLLEKMVRGLEKGQENIEDKIKDIGDISQDLYRVDIYATRGNMLRGGVTSTTLKAKLYSWDEDITDDVPAEYFTWTRNSGYEIPDAEWNTLNGNGVKNIILVEEDVGEQSTFLCTVNDNDKLFAEAQIIVSSNFTLEGIEVEISDIDEIIENLETNTQEAVNKANEAKTSADNVLAEMDTVNAEIEAAKKKREELEGQLTTLTETLEAEYATKGELTEIDTALSAEIEKNAAQISTSLTRIDNIKIDADQAIVDAKAAQDAADTAQDAADTAQRNYEILQQQADATDTELAKAQKAVIAAQNAANAAQDAADTAQAAADSLDDRVTTAESTITQTSNLLNSTVTKVTNIETAVEAAQDAADTAQAKANTAQNAANTAQAAADAADAKADEADAEIEDVRQIIIEQSSSILQTAEEITLNILKGYTKTEDLETYKTQIENQFKASAEGFEFTFSEMQSTLDALGGEISTQKEYIRLIDGKIYIGNESSPISTVYTENGLEIRYNGQMVARYTNEVLEVRNIKADNQVAVSDKWALRLGAYVEGSGYNLDIVWTGGA